MSVNAGDVWIELVSGCIGGSAGVAVGQPFDYVKVQLQIATANKLSIVRVVQSTLRSGITPFFRGLSAVVAGNVPINAVVFGVNGAVNSGQNVSPTAADWKTIGQLYLSATVAGAVQSVILAPTDLIKCQMQTNSAHRTAAEYALNIVRTYGVARLYRGLAVTALRDVPTYGIWFVVYELSTREFGKSAAVQIVGGAAAGALSWIVAFPVDVVKTVIQSAPIADAKTITIRAALSDVVSKGGLSHLYRGCALTALRGALVAAVTFIVYDAVRLTIKSMS